MTNILGRFGRSSRRLRRLAVATAVLSLGVLGPPSGAPAVTGFPLAGALSGTVRAAAGIQQIQHVIVVMQENRSFDEYFGTFPGANGVPASTCVNDPITHNCVHAYHDPADHQGGGPHSADASTADINGGQMNGFIAQAETQAQFSTCDPVPPSGTCTDVMGYHDNRELGNYWSYASNYVLQDAMFAPMSDWSLPTHLFMVSGWSARCTDKRDPSTCAPTTESPDHADSGGNKLYDCDDFDKTNVPPPGTITCSRYPTPDYGWTDLTYLLHKNHASWKEYYGKNAPEYWKPLGDFVTVHKDGELGNIVPYEDRANGFEANASGTTCNLPNVSWVIPGPVVSEHPPSVSSRGQEYVTSLVDSVMSGPCWESSAIFVSWDDWGGFYDHVVPPAVDAVGYGIRVPGLMISPYAKLGLIDHQTLSHDAYLKFIEDDFLGGQRIDPATDGRPDPRPDVRENAAILGDLAQEFDFSQAPRTPMLLPLVFDSKQQGPPGTQTAFTGKHFAPNEVVTFKMGCTWAQCPSSTVVGTTTTTGKGDLKRVVVTIPAGFPGQNVIGAVGSTGDFAETNFTES